MVQQTTIQRPFKLSGRGLHTGLNVEVNIHPAPADSGILFRRTDMGTPVDIPALATMVSDTSRGTTIASNGARIATVEHLMSALHGMQIDNAVVEVGGEEIPILDGSARLWVDAIRKAGIQQLQQPRKVFRLEQPLRIGNDSGMEIQALPAPEFKVSTIIDFKSEVIGHQEAELTGYDSYADEVAPSRTFVLLHEIEPLLANNLIKGGDLDNALVFVDHKLQPDNLENLARLFGKDLKSIKVRNGVLNNIDKYFPNEPARHKMLDFIGDIALAGMRVQAHFIIKCPGHKANNEFARLLQQHIAEHNTSLK